jgi:hypothetical protein
VKRFLLFATWLGFLGVFSSPADAQDVIVIATGGESAQAKYKLTIGERELTIYIGAADTFRDSTAHPPTERKSFAFAIVESRDLTTGAVSTFTNNKALSNDHAFSGSIDGARLVVPMPCGSQPNCLPTFLFLVWRGGGDPFVQHNSNWPQPDTHWEGNCRVDVLATGSIRSGFLRGWAFVQYEGRWVNMTKGLTEYSYLETSSSETVFTPTNPGDCDPYLG